jgi:hypothetical protein
MPVCLGCWGRLREWILSKGKEIASTVLKMEIRNYQFRVSVSNSAWFPSVLLGSGLFGFERPKLKLESCSGVGTFNRDIRNPEGICRWTLGKLSVKLLKLQIMLHV